MTVTQLIGRLLGLERVEAIEKLEPSFSAPWAQDAPAWLLFGCLALAALVVLFYVKCQPRRKVSARIALVLCQTLLLSLLLLALAEPVLTVKTSRRLRPSLWLLFDGTDSMAIADRLSDTERTRLAKAVGLAEKSPRADSASSKLTRADYVKALVAKEDDNLLTRLGEDFRLRAFLFDRPEGVRALELSAEADTEIDHEHLAGQLTTDGQVTALGAALEDLGRRDGAGNLAAVVILSDFNQNAGPSALEAAQRLGAKVHTVGVGPTATVDVGVDLQVPPLMKKAERSTLIATLRQQGLTGRTVTVNFSAHSVGGPGGDVPIPDGQKQVELRGPTQTIELPYVPAQSGQFVFTAEVKPLSEEVVRQNNRAQRESTVRDDFLRLLFVEYEPTWEWRFIKEVFHRDKLVGEAGFRTFLRSSDPKVRQTNELFLDTLSSPRSEFFAHDVIFLGDMPASTLSPRFCRLVEEFVGNFGGGLVILAGPRFGPGQLADTPLGDLLPVKVDRDARIRQSQPFRLRLTAEAAQYDFMQLGTNAAESRKAWANLGLLPWYRPVERLKPMATALAEHPTDTCVDGRSLQPLIAIQNYGRGEVVYVGFNETWRLRREYGQRYYRQFWGQMIHRLALRHALGAGKRFVVRTDRRRYHPDDRVLLTVEAYDANFKPLGEDKLPGSKLTAEWIRPEQGVMEDSNVRKIGVSQLRVGVFEARIPVFADGQHRLRVKDPITGEYTEVTFGVASVSAERRRAGRNVALARAIAETTGGRYYDLASVDRLTEQIDRTSKVAVDLEVISLWNPRRLTWLFFACVVMLMLGQWLGRKWVNLS